MTIERIVNSVFSSNSYIISEGSEAVIIDIGDIQPVVKYIAEHNLKTRGLFITHTHYDHIYGIKEFIRLFPHVPIYTSTFGMQAFNCSKWNFSRYHEDLIEIESQNIVPLDDGSEIKLFLSHTIRALATPGHDPSCLSFMIDELLFTGDSYIPGIKVVATFPKSNKIEASFWYNKLKALSNEYSIYPGHGDAIIKDI